MTSPHQKKIRINGPVVVTANRLSDGLVVYRGKDGNWSELISKAEILTQADEAERALKSAQRESLVAVGPYIAPVTVGVVSTQPGNLRERIRVTGPTFALPSEQENTSYNRSGQFDRAA